MAIHRGTLPQDNYTPVLNAWLRDPATTFKGKGILGAIASHREDYELTVVQLVAQSKDGPDAVYSGLKELVAVGYLRMERKRDELGRLGESEFFLIAEPPGMYERVAAVTWGNGKGRKAATTSGKSRSGESTSGGSRSGESRSGESATKKITKKKTTPKNTTTPTTPPAPATVGDLLDELDQAEEEAGRGAKEAAEVLAAVLERAEVPADRHPTGARDKTLRQLVAGHLAAGWPADRLTTALADPLTGARSVYAVLRTRLEELGRPPRPPAPRPAAESLPTWCGRCDKVRRLDAADPTNPDRLVPCPRCHPDHALAGAAR